MNKTITTASIFVASLLIFGSSSPLQDQNYQVVKLTDDQIKEFVESHNFYRKQVGSPPLKWSKELASYAQEWAEKSGKDGCKMRHRPNSGKFAQKYGENIYWASYESAPATAVEAWASEKADFDKNPKKIYFSGVGHYTQIVWRSSTELGCAIVRCKSNTVVICNYNPRGNYVGYGPFGK